MSAAAARLRLIGRGAALLLVAAAAAAPAATGPIYRMKWNIPPQEGPSASVPIEGEKELLRLRLVPPGLFTAPEDVADAGGNVIVPAGMQLVRLVSEARIACTIHKVAKKGVEGALFLGSLKRVCLVDRDSDGRFDSSFLRSTNGTAYFLLRGRLGATTPIRPVRLAEIDPEQIEGGPRVAVKATAKPGKWAQLSANVGADDRSAFALVDGSGRFTSSHPSGEVDLYGGRILVSSDGAGNFIARAVGPFSADALDFWD